MPYQYCRILLLFISSVSLSAAPREVWLDVFIHGTYGIRSQLTLKTFHKILKDKLPQTPCKHVVHQIRHDPYFYQIQAIQELGLRPIKPCTKRCSSASLFAQLFDRNTKQDTTTKSLSYTFGWSGLLSHSERSTEAANLYLALYKEKTRLQKQFPHAQIHIRLIGYSHGGSVALHLAQHYTDERALTVDELILVATPIQPETEDLIHHQLFKKVYNFYSKRDLIQAFDCFSHYKLFSRRIFCKRSLHEKLVQIEIKIVASKYPDSSSYHINRSPNHTEWWFFGWTLSSYRSEFITNPLPLGVFIPNFLQLIEQYAPDACHLKMTLRPDGTATIKDKKQRNHSHAYWIDPQELQELKTYARAHQPNSLCLKEHKAHLNSARKSTPAGLQKLEKKHSKACRKKSGRVCICGAGANDLP